MVGTRISLPILDLTGIVTTGFTAIRFVVIDDGGTPTGINRATLARWPTQTAERSRVGPCLQLTYQMPSGFQGPQPIHGHGAM